MVTIDVPVEVVTDPDTVEVHIDDEENITVDIEAVGALGTTIIEDLADKVSNSRTLTAGAGLTGGGDLSADRTFNVGAGTGVTVNADDVALDTAHARNVDHSAVALTAGAGLTGGGDISASRSFDVGAGTGITVNADDVAVNQAFGFSWTAAHQWTLAPAYNLASNVLGVGIIMPLDSATQTVAAGKAFSAFRFSQTNGQDISFTVGSSAVAIGVYSSMTAAAGSHASSATYASVFHVTNVGDGTGRGVHAAAFGSGASSGTLNAVNAQIQPVATQGFTSAYFASLTSSGVHDLAFGMSVESSGDRYAVAYGNGVAALPVGLAYFRAWMATGSSVNARAFQILNNAGSEIAYWHKDGSLNAIGLTLASGANVPAPITGSLLQLKGADATATFISIDSFGSSARFAGRRAEGTAASPSAVTVGLALAAFEGWGYGATGYSAARRGGIDIIAGENWTDTAQGTQIIFRRTELGGTTLSEGMRLTTNGAGGANLCINTGGASFGAGESLAVSTLLAVGTISTGPWFLVGDPGDGTAMVSAHSNHPLTFRTNATERMRLSVAGGLSINTTTDAGAGMIRTNSATFMIRTSTSYTNGAGAGAGTLTNAPAAGNPTKWIPVDDNGTTRHVPAW